MSISNCCFLTCIQISQEADQVVWYSHLFNNFPHFVVIHTVKSFGIVNKAEIDVFLELACFSDNPIRVGNLISGSSAFSKTSLEIWKFTVHVLLNPVLENFEHYFTSVKIRQIETCEPGKLRGVRNPWAPWPLWPGSASRGKALAWPAPGVLLLLPSRARPGSEFSLVTPAPQSRWHSPGPGR